MYQAATEDVDVVDDVDAALDWVNGFVERIASA